MNKLLILSQPSVESFDASHFVLLFVKCGIFWCFLNSYANWALTQMDLENMTVFRNIEIRPED